MSDDGIEVTMLLCDWAEAIQGKLYVMGGGWRRLTLNEPTATMALAIKIDVPWDKTNTPHKLKAQLVTEDGELVSVADGKKVEFEAQMETGRPPGSKSGTSFSNAMAIKVAGMPIQPGSYSWRFLVNNQEKARAAFDIVPGPNLPKGANP